MTLIADILSLLIRIDNMRVKIFFDARAQSAIRLVPMTNISKVKTDGQNQPSPPN